MSDVAQVVVVGAGISGLSCAYALRRMGLEVLVLESAGRPGGVIQSIRRDGFLLELGPQSFSATARLRQLFEELGLGKGLLTAPRRAPRFLLSEGQLRPVPQSPTAFFTSRLFGVQTKWTILRDLIGYSRPPAEEESLASFVRRKFTAELLEKLAGPFVSGIYAGDSEKLSMPAAFPQICEAERASGSVIRGIGRAKAKQGTGGQAALQSFVEGNEALVRALAGKLEGSLLTGMTAERITTNGAHASAGDSRAPAYLVNCRGPNGARQIGARRLVLALPAPCSADLLDAIMPAASALLREIEYAPVAIAALGYSSSSISHRLEGFGFLVPRTAGLRTLGTVWNSSLFPGRAPQGHVLLTSFLGGATDRAAVELSPEQSVAVVHREITPMLEISGPPVFSNVTRWSRGIPQYNLGHTARLEAITRAVASCPGLFLTGNYLAGPAIGACVEHAQTVADRASASL
jgi:protoporphyrinogen/coproporphyrinogen III oxidase